MKDVTINLGVEESTGKWVAELHFPDGTVRSTDKRYDTREELEADIKLWLKQNDLGYDRFN